MRAIYEKRNRKSRMIIANNLKQLRERSGWTQGKVAIALGVHRPTISKLEDGGRSVKAEELWLFAEIYDVELWEILEA